MSKKAMIGLSAVQMVASIKDKSFSAVELAQETLGFIQERDAEVRAWLCWSEGRVLERARLIDSGEISGVLAGVPVGIKDIIDTSEYPTCHGSPIYKGHQPGFDAASVALIKEAGGIVVGKTVTTEFAYFQPGPTANPHNLKHTPGGSSSGSAAAVAAGMVPVALATQTAGSLIRPASYCGIWGYKPSFGLFSLAGIKPMAQSLDTLGVLARHVEDLALMQAVLLKSPGCAALEPFGGVPTIGVCRTYDWPSADEDSRRVLGEAAEALADTGANVVECDLPSGFEGVTQAQRVIQAFETARALSLEHACYLDKLSPSIIKLIDEGMACSQKTYFEAQLLVAECRAKSKGMFDLYDAVLAPSAPGAAPEGLKATGDPIFSRMWMPLHVPCINMPFGRGSSGLPVGVQLISGFLHDSRLLQLSAWAEQKLGIHVEPV